MLCVGVFVLCVLCLCVRIVCAWEAFYGVRVLMCVSVCLFVCVFAFVIVFMPLSLYTRFLN